MFKSRMALAAAGLALLALVGSSLSLEGRRRPPSPSDAGSFSRGARPGSSPFRMVRPAAQPARLSLEPGDRSWNDRFGRPGFDWIVHALAAYGGSLIAGGDFTLAESTAVDHVARWNGVTWEPLGSGLGPSCSGWKAVEAFTIYDGDLVAGGSFVVAGNDTVNGLARWNGATWVGIGGGVWNTPQQMSECARVHAVLSFEGQLVVGGAFDHAGEARIDNLARWDGMRWTRMGAGFMGEVRALAIHDGALVAACDFYNTGQSLIGGVLQWNGNEWSPLGLGPEAYVTDLVEYRDDLIAAGNFTRAGGMTALCVARWDGVLWTALGSGIEGEEWDTRVDALGVYDDKLFVGGEFTHAGGVPASSVAIWDGSGWSSAGAGLQTGFLDEEVYALLPFDGLMVAGGNFSRSGSTQADFIAGWNGSTWTGLGATGLGLDGIIGGMAQHDGGLVVAGSFEQLGHVASKYIASWDGTGWEAMDTAFIAESTYVVAIASSGSDLYLSSNHVRTYADSIGSQVFRWDGDSWQALGPKVDRYVSCLAVYRGEVVAAGRFSRAGGTPANNIARWDGTAWQALGRGVIGEYGEIHDLLVFRDELVAAGTFTWAGDNTADNIARWDGQSWHRLGSGLTGVIYTDVWDLVEYGGNLVAVGEFDAAGDVPVASVAMWDGSQWAGLGAGIPGDWDLAAWVTCAAAAGRHLFVGGLFERAGDVQARNIAHWDGAAWTAMGSGLNELPVAMTFFENALYVGGWFTAAGGKKSAHFAIWSDSAVPVEVSDLEAVSESGAVRIAWRLAADAWREVLGVQVERGTTAAGPFTQRTPAPLDPASQMQFTDTEVRAGEEYWYRIVLERAGGSHTATRAVPVRVVASPTARTCLEAVFVEDSAVHIRYTVGPAPESVALAVYDVRGRQIWSKPQAIHAPGAYTSVWDLSGIGRPPASRGIYFVKLTAGGASHSTRLVLLRP